MHLPIHHVHYIGRMFFVGLHKFCDPWKLRRAECTLNVRKALLFCFFIQCGLERVQRRCLASIRRVSAVELWWRVLIPFLVLVNCQVWCFLVFDWNKSVRPACPKEEWELWCCVEAAGGEKAYGSGFALLPGCQERWMSLWGASGEAEDFFGLSASSLKQGLICTASWAICAKPSFLSQ